MSQPSGAEGSVPPEERNEMETRKEASARDRSDSEGARRKRSRSHSRSRSRSRGGHRRHSRSPSRDRYDDRRRRDRKDRRDYGRDRSRSRDRYDDRRRDRRRDHSRERDGGRRGGGGNRRRDALTPLEEEQRKLERTYRTVQVYNLNLRAEEHDVFQFFKQAGPVADIKIIKDRKSGRSKGFAYVEFQERDSVIAALSLSGQPVLGQPVMVKMSEAEKNLAWEAAQAAKKQAASMSAVADAMAAGAAGGPTFTTTTAGRPMPGRLIVSNLPVNVVEAELRQIFDPFGQVDFLTVQRDAMGVSQGIALVQYNSSENAAIATEQLNQGGIELAPGMPMKITPAPLDYNPMAAAAGGGAAITAAAAVAAAGMLMPGAAGNGHAPGAENPSVLEERIDIDADDGGGMRLTAQHRMALMTRLAANAGIEVPQAPLMGPGGVILNGKGQHGGPGGGSASRSDLALEQGVLGPASPIPTQCLLLKNMFDPGEEEGEDWDQEIAQEVKTECSKFGNVLFVHVDATSKGFVYLKFESTAAATAAQAALHGRWFNQKQVCADFQFTPLFNSHFHV
ncbi:hypothetical protein Ndes2526B_g08705 [Nannochloris sp. 'desiccata']